MCSLVKCEALPDAFLIHLQFPPPAAAAESDPSPDSQQFRSWKGKNAAKTLLPKVTTSNRQTYLVVGIGALVGAMVGFAILKFIR